MAMRNAVIPAPRKPIHQAPTHSGLSVVSSVLLGEAMVRGLLTGHPCPFQHMHRVTCSLPWDLCTEGNRGPWGYSCTFTSPSDWRSLLIWPFTKRAAPHSDSDCWTQGSCIWASD